jgi:predicted permease
MMSLGELGRRLVYLVRRDRRTAELEEEIRLHVQLRAERLEQQGSSAREARFAARRRFGNPTSIQERSRDMWNMEWLEHAAADFRFAIRRLRSRPGFSLSAITVAALGIGATTAVFSAVDAAMLRPLPFSSPADLVALPEVKIPFGEEEGEHDGIVSIEHVRTLTDFFSSAAAFAAGGLNLEDPDRPQRLQAGVVTDNFFSTLGVRPVRGRLFTYEEGRPKGPRAVIISHALWRSYFNGGDISGKSLALSGRRYAVVGVMPASFRFPSQSDVWIPLTVPTTVESFSPFRGFLPSRVIARVAPGVSIEAASRRLLARWEQEVGPPTPGRRTNLENMVDDVRRGGAAIPLQREIVGDQRKALTILMSATVLLLLIAAANVANLLLSDGASRRREVALREVLGASRSRIARQLLVESIVLALAGALIGLVIAPAALGVLRAMMPSDLAGTAPVHVDLRVLTFATGLALVTGILFGLWPAVGTARVDAAETIKSGGGYGATSATLGRARRLLITAEVALTVVLLVGSGLMLKSFYRLMTQDFGMNPAHSGTLELTFAGAGAAELALTGGVEAVRRQRIQTMIDRLAADPSIEAVGVVNDLPLRGGGGIGALIEADGVPQPKGGHFPRYLMASGGYFKAMGIPLLRGRTFLATDDTIGSRAAIISNEMAKLYWPNLDPIGRTFHLSRDSVRYAVVGVVADVREGRLDRPPGPQMYFSASELVPNNLALVARSRLPRAALLSRLTDAVRFAAPQQAVFNVRMMDDVVGASVASRRTNTTLIVLFGGLALVLSAFGVYAVVSYGVARRTREFGIRAALGANGADIVTLVGREMVSVVAVGLLLGVVLAWGLVRLMSSLLFEVPAHDLQTFAIVPLILILPAVVATLVPAWRAMRVSPTEVMRAE